MRNILASALVVAAFVALTSTGASAWCGHDNYGGYDASYDNSYDTPDIGGGDDFQGGFGRHDRFDHRHFERPGFGGSRGGRRR